MKTQLENITAPIRRVLVLASLALALSLSVLDARAQLEVIDGNFESDFVSSKNTPNGELGNFGMFWRESTTGDQFTGVLNPSSPPASPLSGKVGQFRGDSFIYQNVGALEADTTYTIAFDFQLSAAPWPFYATVAFLDEFGNPETAVDMFGNWYIVPIGGEHIAEASFQATTMPGPVETDDVYAHISFVPPPSSAPYVGSAQLNFTTSSSASGSVALLFGAIGVAPRTQVDNVAISSQAVPEPTSVVLAAFGVGALLLRRKRRN